VNGVITRYSDIAKVDAYIDPGIEAICDGIRERLVAGVAKRLDADAPLGFLLSGGLDSSLVCAISARLLKKPIRTFSIGMDKDAIDLKYARVVADYIRSDHTEVIITRDDVIKALPTWSSCWVPTTSPPSARPSACTWCVSTSTSTRTSGYC
jgi:asparagine synthase (glutamine-hydrolysing)